MTARRMYKPGVTVPGTIYRVVRVLGEGGMGVVYEVVDTSVDAPYVMKTLHRDLLHRKDLAKRMQAEAKVLAKLRHENIVRVYTAGISEDDVPYYIMDKLNGQSLRQLLKRKGGKLPVANAIVITVQLLKALERAHEFNIIHRDVKPDNIFLHAEDGETSTKLLDFGVMALIAEGSRETGRHFQGTLRYASPEQVAGLKVSPKTDLYAAGLVLYEMIAGRGPFAELKSDMAIAGAHLNQKPPRLRRLVPSIRKDLDELVMSALEKDPDKRPRDAFRFAAELREIGHKIETERGGDTLANTTLDTLLGELHDAMTEAGPAPVATGKSSGDRTDVGMDAPPIEGPTLEEPPPEMALGPTPAPAAAAADTPIDRRAPTRTSPPKSPRAPKHGTEQLSQRAFAPIAFAPTSPSPPPADAVPEHEEAPPSEPRAPSLISQAGAARSVSNEDPPRRTTTRNILIGIGVAAVAVAAFLQGKASSTHATEPKATNVDSRATAVEPPAPSQSAAFPVASSAPAASNPIASTPDARPSATSAPVAAPTRRSSTRPTTVATPATATPATGPTAVAPQPSATTSGVADLVPPAPTPAPRPPEPAPELKHTITR